MIDDWWSYSLLSTEYQELTIPHPSPSRSRVFSRIAAR
jgi:hypothetical protein